MRWLREYPLTARLLALVACGVVGGLIEPGVWVVAR